MTREEFEDALNDFSKGLGGGVAISRHDAEQRATIARLEGALREIAEGKGPFDIDNYKFACNVIENMKDIARAALEGSAPPSRGCGA